MSWTDILYVLPAGACLFWVVFYSLAACRTGSFHVTVLLFLALGAFMLAPRSLFTYVTGTSLAPLMMHYLDRIRKNEDPPFFKILWLVFPTTLFSVGLIMNMTAPADQLPGYNNTLNSLYHIIITVEDLVFYGYMIFHCVREGFQPIRKFYGFLFKRRSAKLLEIQYCLMTLGTIPFMIMVFPKLDPYESPVFPFLLAAFIYAAAYVSLAGNSRELTLSDLLNVTRHNYNKNNKGVVVEAMIVDMLPEADPASLSRIRTRIDRMMPEDVQGRLSLARRLDSSVKESWRNDPLFESFKREVIDKQLFLRPGLSLQYVADILKTNKTYVSKMVNNAYNLGFPELLNTLRVDYAQQYLIRHPEAKQSEVATACGFLSASSFNIIFKRIAGQPPKLWVASNER